MVIKKTLFMAVAFSVLSLPLSAIAAEELSATQDISQYRHLGDVSVSGLPTAEDAEAKVARLAEAKGADFSRIIFLTQPGHSSQWNANAALYTKQ